MKQHRCKAMEEAISQNSLSVDDMLIHHYEGMLPETSRWYLTVKTYYGITDIPGIRFCPFCGVELDEEPHD